MGMCVSNSECSYSGLNDEQTAEEPAQVQNYGLYARFMPKPTGKDNRAVPGFACNGHIAPLKGDSAPM